MEDKYNKLTPIIEKLLKLHFKDKIEMVKVVRARRGRQPIRIVFKLTNQCGIYSAITINGRMRTILYSVLNLNSWEYELTKKY
jgi:coproporphyrinogen III oxidase